VAVDKARAACTDLHDGALAANVGVREGGAQIHASQRRPVSARGTALVLLRRCVRDHIGYAGGDVHQTTAV